MGLQQKPELECFTGTENLGNVIFEQEQLNTKFSEVTLPFSTPTGNNAWNWKGRVRTIVLQGYHDGEGFTGATANDRIENFIETIEDWINGVTFFENKANIQGPIAYTNSFGIVHRVKCFDWTYSVNVGDSFRVNYSLLMKVV